MIHPSDGRAIAYTRYSYSIHYMLSRVKTNDEQLLKIFLSDKMYFTIQR